MNGGGRSAGATVVLQQTSRKYLMNSGGDCGRSLVFRDLTRAIRGTFTRSGTSWKISASAYDDFAVLHNCILATLVNAS